MGGQRDVRQKDGQHYGREDGWIETLSALTNLHQKQAFQLWQLFSETMLEDDEMPAETRQPGFRRGGL